MSGFDDAFRRVIGHEGGYVNHPRDPGGETKFGITKRTYPDLDIRNLTLDDAKAIYRRDFWNKLRLDEMPAEIGFDLFDAAINHGRGNAIRFLQRAAGVAADGVVGPVTLAAINDADPQALLARFNGHRLEFFSDLSRWDTFGKGWARRVAANLQAVPDGARGDAETRLERLEAFRAAILRAVNSEQANTGA